jgi:hypothetical protein
LGVNRRRSSAANQLEMRRGGRSRRSRAILGGGSYKGREALELTERGGVQ